MVEESSNSHNASLRRALCRKRAACCHLQSVRKLFFPSLCTLPQSYSSVLMERGEIILNVSAFLSAHTQSWRRVAEEREGGQAGVCRPLRITPRPPDWKPLGRFLRSYALVPPSDSPIAFHSSMNAVLFNTSVSRSILRGIHQQKVLLAASLRIHRLDACSYHDGEVCQLSTSVA